MGDYRICLVAPALPIGGLEKVLAILANEFVKNFEREVHIILIGRNREVEYDLSNKIKIHWPSFVFNSNRRTWCTIKTSLFLRRKVKEINPDVVISFGQTWSNLVLLSLLKTNFKVYISSHSNPNKNLSFTQSFLRKQLYPNAHGYIALTSSEKDVCMKYKWNQNVKVIPNPISNFQYEENFQKENIVLFVGRFINTRYVDHLIKSFSKIANLNWKLVIVGEDHIKSTRYYEKYKNLIEYYQMGNFIYLEGKQNNVVPYFQKSKVFVLPSVSEGSPMVIGEAFTFSIPVIAYDCTGPKDLITDGKDGFLIEELNQKQLQERLNLLMNNEDLRKSMAENAYNKAREFTPKKIAEMYLENL
jgi:glycosyltransferase involved in cell wall biosynthesis